MVLSCERFYCDDNKTEGCPFFHQSSCCDNPDYCIVTGNDIAEDASIPEVSRGGYVRPTYIRPADCPLLVQAINVKINLKNEVLS